jgi:hypothetical protein
LAEEPESFHPIGDNPEMEILPKVSHDPLDNIDIHRIILDKEQVGGR